MYNHNKAQQSKNRVHISWDILYGPANTEVITQSTVVMNAEKNIHTILQRLEWRQNTPFHKMFVSVILKHIYLGTGWIAMFLSWLRGGYK